MSEKRYLVTARKYRPQRFQEIVAQEHVTETLKNAIHLDRLAHAYLFSGPRGVGKTTAARILAKAINCTIPLDQRDQGEPCRACESCKTFEEGRSMNIIEIDAASNNRVEDIRDLRETVLIPPQGSLKKVYIIDEVHMLSNAAFNALLKTLEEPPPHALFIFATTEPNKVLATILSRCQRFDFRRIAVSEIMSHLNEICREEHIEADEASLMLIAHKGDGALRDALSAFDQAVSLCGTTLTYAELAKAFGVVGIDLYFEVTEHIKGGDSARLLLLVEQIVSQGFDLQEFLVGLAGHFRNMLVGVTMKDTTLIEAAESVKQRYARESLVYGEADLLRLLMLVADGEQRLKTSVQPRLQLELTLLKMAAMAHVVDLKEALRKIDALDANLPTTPAQPASTPGESMGTPAPAPHEDSYIAPVAAPGAQVVEKKEAKASVEPGMLSPESSPSTPSPPVRSASIVTLHADKADTRVTSGVEEEVAPEEPANPVDTPKSSTELRKGEQRTPQQQYESLFGPPALKVLNPDGKSKKEGPTSAAVEEAVLVEERSSVGEVEWVKGSWKAYLLQIKEERIHVSALLQHTEPLDVRNATLVLSVPDEFHKRMLASQSDFLLERLAGFVSLSIERLSFVIDIAKAEQKAAQETAREIDPYEYMQKKRNENPVIKAIFEDFGGEMVW